ncbi:nucleotide-diphospho-sugar transferase [Nemania sp. FL0031]|nr:nucleotide-diphospho-sugar transferase [Nemania sp. FL0031]
MPSAIYFLLGNLLWELSERRRASKYIQQYKPFPLPSLDKRLWIPSEVSIIVPTIDYDENFQRAIISWLANKPLELIVVTTNSQFLQAKQFVNSAAIRRANHITKIILLEGFNHSNGRILAFVDDDVFWRPTTLTQLLAPFEQPDVGLVGTDIQSHVPKERRDPSVITGWEVAALRNRSKRRGGSKAFYVADGSTNFTISGATMLLRAEIVQDPVFQWEFAQETFLGVPQNSGDDSFITRWVLFHHLRAGRQRMRKWRLGIQITPEAFVSTTLKTDSSFVHQMKRWLRTGLRYRLTCIFSDPGFRAFRRTTPYMARKMAEGMLNPILNMLWYISFYQTLRTQPFVALLFALYYLYGLVTGMRAFAREFPYCRRKIWAAIIADKVPQVSDFYCWATLFVENWASRPSIDIK